MISAEPAKIGGSGGNDQEPGDGRTSETGLSPGSHAAAAH